MLFYTGIKTIPKSYYEAALIDGANFVQVCLRITIPLLQDVIKYVLILSMLRLDGILFACTRHDVRRPGDMSRTVIYQMYYMAFETSRIRQRNGHRRHIYSGMPLNLLPHSTFRRKGKTGILSEGIYLEIYDSYILARRWAARFFSLYTG